MNNWLQHDPPPVKQHVHPGHPVPVRRPDWCRLRLLHLWLCGGLLRGRRGAPGAVVAAEGGGHQRGAGFPHIFALNFVLIAGWQALLLHVPLHHGRGNAHRLRLQTGKIFFYPY